MYNNIQQYVDEELVRDVLERNTLLLDEVEENVSNMNHYAYLNLQIDEYRECPRHKKHGCPSCIDFKCNSEKITDIYYRGVCDQLKTIKEHNKILDRYFCQNNDKKNAIDRAKKELDKRKKAEDFLNFIKRFYGKEVFMALKKEYRRQKND